MPYDFDDYEADACDSYEECAMWTEESYIKESYDEMYGELDGPWDISEDARREMQSDVRGFLADVGDLVNNLDAKQVGHDFWLTRNGHGTGFWDRGLGELGEELTRRCKPYGEASLYVGDNGEIEYYR